MKIVEQNPFRLLGIISNASAKETEESEIKILRYLEVGKSANLKFDITPPLNSIDRTQDLIIQAKNRIHDDFEKLSYSIFWFIKGSSIDKIALDKLSSEKNIEKTLETFKKGSRSFTISKSSFTSIINFSTLEIASYKSHKDKKRFKNAIKYKYQVIQDQKVFLEFEKLLTLKTHKINQNEFKNKFLENTKSLLKEVFPRTNQHNLLLDIFSEDQNIVKELEAQSISDIIEKIKEHTTLYNTFYATKSNQSIHQIIKSKSTILRQAEKVFTEIEPYLKKLKRVAGKNNFQFTNIVDEAYGFVNGTIVLCYNAEMDNLNNKLRENSWDVTTTINKTNFKPYVSMLETAFKNISSINCRIRSTISTNLKNIKKTYNDLEALKIKNGVSRPRVRFNSDNWSSDSYSSSNYNHSSDENFLVSFFKNIFFGIIGFILGLIGIVIQWIIGIAIIAIPLAIIGAILDGC